MQSVTRTPFTLVARVTRTATPASMRGVATSSANFYNEQPRFSTTNANANAVHSLGREQPHTQPLTNNKGDAAGYTTFAGPSTTAKNNNTSYGGTANRERNGVWCVAGAAGTQNHSEMFPWAHLLSVKSLDQLGGGPFEEAWVIQR